MSADNGPMLVQAVYSFKGKNNDELCFKKGDIITIAQKEEGGWWEGTLGEKTGWFPSNYVKEYNVQDSAITGSSKCTSPSKLSPDIIAQQKVYRNLVLKDLIDSEKAHVTELQGLLKNFLHPLEKSDILTRDEYRQLVGNINVVVETHQQLLTALEDCSQRPPLEQRVGKVFLTSAPRIKQVHLNYCSSHPRAVCVLDKYKNELNTFMESQGAATPGLIVLTIGLSKPFRRLEKYCGMLQELERHVEENHPDRGDTQRSISVYKDIASTVSATRRQKELELEVLNGGVRGWEGEDLSCLGEILHMGSVAIGPDYRDRYLVLFRSTLLMLSVSQRMSAFLYEGKLPLTGINVTKLEDSDSYKNAFEISGPMIEHIIAVCQTREDQQNWVDCLKQQIRAVRKSSVSSPPPISPPPSKPQPLPPPHVSCVPYTELSAYFAELVKRGVITRIILKSLLYPQFKENTVINILGVKIRRKHKVECVIFPQQVSLETFTAAHTFIASTDSDCSSSSSESMCSNSVDTNENILERQNAIDITSDDESSLYCVPGNPFGFINYYDPSKVSCDESSFQENIVLGAMGSDTPLPPDTEHHNNFGRTSKCSFTTLLHSNSQNNVENQGNKFVVSNNPGLEITPWHRRYSCTVCDNLDFDEISSTVAKSNESSFEYNPWHKEYPHEVCENLSHLKDGVIVQTTNYADVRQSLPAFVLSENHSSTGLKNYFSSKTLTTQSLPLLPEDIASPSTHSSCLDLPMNVIPMPSTVLAELLYNLEPSEEIKVEHSKVQQQDSASSGHSIESVQTTIGTDEKTKNCDFSQNKIIQVSKYKMNSISFPINDLKSKEKGCNFTNIAPVTTSDENLSCIKSVCVYDKDVVCNSSRSSDSGLADIAENSALTSPDLSNVLPEHTRSVFNNKINHFSIHPESLTPRESSEFDESCYEAQCVCTSPFGSTPRTSAQTSFTSEKIFIDVKDSLASQITTSPINQPSTAPQVYQPDSENIRAPSVGIYRSGMYAHWWMKKKLPTSALTSTSLQTEERTNSSNISSS